MRILGYRYHPTEKTAGRLKAGLSKESITVMVIDLYIGVDLSPCLEGHKLRPTSPLYGRSHPAIPVPFAPHVGKSHSDPFNFAG